MRVLILGGTAEGRALAAELHGREGFEVVSSLAGRTASPLAPDGVVRIGGFGGAEGLARYLREAAVDVVVDATHPFATTVSGHAVWAAEVCGVSLVTLRRPEWVEEPGDRWVRVADVAGAAQAAAAVEGDGCVFVTTGRKDVGAYGADARHLYLIRTVEPPDGVLPPRHVLLGDRGPYSVEGEGALMDSYGVCALVTKNSGGALTAAKLVAARVRGIPVVMVDRPVVGGAADGASVGSVAEAVALLASGF